MAALTKNGIGGFLARQGILVAFVIFMIGFALANGRFLDPDNIMGVVRSSAIMGVMALGVTFVVISGNLDLSVGSMMSFSTIVVLDLHDKIGPTLAIPAMFAMTLCLGAFIGFLVGYLKLNSLIVTLGMLSAIHGLTLTYSGGKNMDIVDKEGTWFSVFGQGDALGIPVPILLFALLAVVLGQCSPRRRSGARSTPWAAMGPPPRFQASAARAWSLPAICSVHSAWQRRALFKPAVALARRTPWAKGLNWRCWPRSSWAARHCSAVRAPFSRR